LKIWKFLIGPETVRCQVARHTWPLHPPHGAVVQVESGLMHTLDPQRVRPE